MDEQPVTAPASGSVFRLKVRLLDTKPPIWRRVLVDGARTLDHVHDVIQAAFGWWGHHLHEFTIGRTSYGTPDPDEDWGPSVIDERFVALDQVADDSATFLYTYDFGDGWEHTVHVEEVMYDTGAMVVPALVDGRRACPPEDCGGPSGYRELLVILADPAHPEHGERLAWSSGLIDPEHWDPSTFERNLRAAAAGQLDDNCEP